MKSSMRDTLATQKKLEEGLHKFVEVYKDIARLQDGINNSEQKRVDAQEQLNKYEEAYNKKKEKLRKLKLQADTK